MSTQSTLRTLLDELTRYLGVPALDPEESGRYRLAFDFRLNVEFVHLNEQAALMVSRCGRTEGLDELRREQLLRDCLSLSLARISESPAVITIEDSTGDLVLYQFLELQTIELNQFHSEVEVFVDELNLWMQFISGKLQAYEPRPGGGDELVITP